jgi:hypothetical protein
MFHFCFNDCIPKNSSNDVLVKHLTVTLTHYDLIKKKFPGSVNGIITDRLPEKVYLNNANFSLVDCIQYLEREIRKIALSNFGKHPVDDYFNEIDIDSLLENEYSITIDNVGYDATNAKLVQNNGGMLFTLAVHNDLQKNTLVICDKANSTCEATNQYGAEANTNYILELIYSDIVKRADGFDKLLALVGECAYDEDFKSEFDNLTYTTQNFLLKEVEHAINRKERTRFYPDDKLIKNVTPGNEKEISVFELRIYSPVAIRMYFYETPNKVYFGSIDKKPKKKIQDNDIKNAASIIKELIALDKN